MDLQQYSSLIGSGEVRPETLAAVPGSMLGRTLNYLTTANNSATAYMQQTAPYIQQMWAHQNPQQQNSQQQQMMSVFIMQQLYKQGRDRALQVETKLLKVDEDKLKQEKEKLETLAQAVEQELKAAKEARNKGLQDMAPKYTA